jgi:hypothetical protein
MAQNAIDDPRVRNEGDNPHARATCAEQGIRFEDFPEFRGQATQLLNCMSAN